MENIYFSPECIEAVIKAGEAIKHVGVVLRDAVCRAAYALGCVVHDMVAAVKATFVPPKWVHYARYARKRRTREKYQRMISRRFIETLRAITAA